MRRQVQILTISIFAAFAALLSNQAAAEPINNVPDTLWDVDGTWVSEHTGQIRAMVWDFEELNGRMYVGGKFTEVVSPDRNTRIPHSFLAAFDVQTGEYISSFTPSLDGAVYAIDVRADGKLVVGGELTGGIAVIDPTTGAIDNGFDANIATWSRRPVVYDLEVSGNDIFAGGFFTRAQGLTVRGLAKLDATTGAINTDWMPRTNFDDVTARIGGEQVWGLAVDAARDRVYLAGKFGGINDNMDAAFFATLDTQNGELRADLPQGLPVDILSHREGERGFSMWQHDVQWRGDTVFLGGQAHQTLIMDADTLTPSKSFFTNKGVGDLGRGGDTQVMFIGKNTLWAGCHCWGSVGEYELGSYNVGDPTGNMLYDEYRQYVTDFATNPPSPQQRVRGFYGIDLDTQELLPSSYELTGQGGGWGLYEDSNGRVWVGGQFTSSGAGERSGLVRFSTDQPAGNGEVEACEVASNGDFEISWTTNGDVEDVVIRRSVDASPAYWRGKVSAAAGVFADSARSGEIVYYAEAKNGTEVGTRVECSFEAGTPAPSNLRATRVEKNLVVLNWQAAGEIEVEVNGQIVGTDSDGWYVASGLQQATEYTFRVRYTGQASFSDAVTVTTLGAPVGATPAPVSCTATVVGANVEVSWASVPEASEVIIQREVDNSGSFFWRGRVAADSSFSDTNRDGSLVYRVKARYAGGDSEYVTCG